MNILIQIIGVAMVVAGIVIMLRPALLFDVLRSYQDTFAIYCLAVLGRLVLGGALVVAAPASLYPVVLSVLGWAVIAVALFFVFVGRARFAKLLAGVLSWPDSWCRASGVFAVLLGGFLVYAVAYGV